jgi:glycine cleavage system H protein
MTKKRTKQGAAEIFKDPHLSRRQFLKNVSIGLGGALVGGVTLTSSCKSGITSSVPTLTSSTPISSVQTTLAPPHSSSITSTASTSPISTPVSIATTTPYSYVAPTEQPKIIRVPNSECTIATDRLYSKEHIWVKTVSTNLVVLGITPTMLQIIYRPYALEISKAGTNIVQDNDTFGDIAGYKLNTSLVSPVSGKIFQVNEILVREGLGQGEYMTTLNSDPWNRGWIIVVQIDNPAEINSLLKPEGYMKELGH